MPLHENTSSAATALIRKQRRYLLQCICMCVALKLKCAVESANVVLTFSGMYYTDEEEVLFMELALVHSERHAA